MNGDIFQGISEIPCSCAGQEQKEGIFRLIVISQCREGSPANRISIKYIISYRILYSRNQI